MKKYQIISHTADLAIRGYGKDIKELYENIVIGLFKEIGSAKLNAQASTCQIKISGEDREALLVNLLNELIFQSETKKIIFTDIEFSKLLDNELIATAYHYPLLAKKIDVKGATYHGLKISRDSRLFFATVIFDV